MNQNVLVSIIVLTYKDFSGLEKTMNAILEQNYPHIEIIVGDDGSPNYSEKFFDAFIDRAKRQNISLIIRHNEHNLGTVKNINEALKLAHGHIIGFLGCGDYYASRDVIKNIVNCFEKNDAEVVTTKMKGISVSNPNRITILPHKKFCKLLKEGNNKRLLSKMFNDNCFFAPATFYKRTVYEKYGIYDERMRLIEDYPFLFNLVLKGAKIKFLDICTVIYLFDGVSSGKASPMILDDLEKIRRLVLFPYIDECMPRERRLFLYNFYRKQSDNLQGKVKTALKYPDQFIYWQYRRVVSFFQVRLRR